MPRALMDEFAESTSDTGRAVAIFPVPAWGQKWAQYGGELKAGWSDSVLVRGAAKGLIRSLKHR